MHYRSCKRIATRLCLRSLDLQAIIGVLVCMLFFYVKSAMGMGIVMVLRIFNFNAHKVI